MSINHFRHLVFLYSFLFLGNCGLSAQRIVEIKYQQGAKGAYVFSAYNLAYCNYILEIHFTTFDNLQSDRPLPYRAEVKPGINKLFSLFPVNPAEPVKFNYSSNYNKGCIDPKPDTAFTYLFPITPGKEAQAYVMDSPPAADNAGQNSWYVIRLKMKPGDTIYAARRGVVTEVQDSDSANDAGISGPGNENYLEIVHGDCSFGHYGILRRKGALVKPGQLVQAGEPIGLVGGDLYGRGSEIRFSVYYNQETDGFPNGADMQKTGRIYVPLQFWTKNKGRGKLKNGAVYKSEFPLVLLNAELPLKIKSKKRKAKR